MLKKITILTAVLVCLISGSALASKVTDVELFYDKGFTTAKIKVDGTVRFSHQTEIAKDGKPYRVIVDLLSATHQLSAKKFLSLPNCPVKAIRTSQYAVNPEAVVRVVFDMDMERVYRIDTKGDYVFIHFSDNDTKPFTAWSSSSNMNDKPAQPTQKMEPVKVASKPAPEQKSVSQLNKEINDDRMASLSSTSPQKEEPKPVSKPVVKEEKSEYYGPKVSSPLVEQPKPKPVMAKAEPKAEQPKAKPAVKQAPVKKEEPKPVVAKAEKPQSKPVAKPTPVKKEESKPVVAKAQPKADKPQSKPVAKPAPVKKEEPKPVVAKANQKADEKAKNTARFRRSTKDSKIQGTLVAEFPKRLVIKYKSKGHRDPFETLINESKQYNNPVDQRIPNVEGLKLVGVIEAGGKDNRALFEDTDGYGYILKTGDKVRKGYVLRVDKDKVYFQIFEYGWSRTVSLRLES